MSAGGRTIWWSDTTLHVAAAPLLAGGDHSPVGDARTFLEEWWGYGTFFVVVALAQGFYALCLLRRPSRPFLCWVLPGTRTIVILWLVTRTTGIPLLGLHAGEVEEVGTLDFFATLAEVCVVFGLGALAMKGLATESRIQVVVVLGVSALLFWHFLHLLAGSSAH